MTITAFAALSLAACLNVFGIGDPDVSVAINLQRPWNPPPVFHVDIDGRRISVAGKAAGQRAEREIQAPGNGTLPVVVRLLSASGETLAEARFSQTFERSKSHWVTVDVGQRRPLGHCIGTLLVIPTTNPPDTAFVMHGSLPEGAIC